MRYVYKDNVPRFAQFAVRVMDCEMDFEHPDRTALSGIDRLESYFASLGMPVRLSGLGITTDEKFDEMAEKSTFFGKRVLTGVKELKKPDIIEILKMSR
jgi:alcohol dehydrogenase YqhD (iron-dependent ADH family)